MNRIYRQPNGIFSQLCTIDAALVLSAGSHDLAAFWFGDGPRFNDLALFSTSRGCLQWNRRQ